MRPLVLLLFLLAVSGCSGMSVEECSVADWRAIGYEDGASGRAASQLGERREACADHGVTPNFVAYRQGREEGLREYCTPAMGYRLGRGGRAFPTVCPAELQGELEDGYRSGREIHQAAARVRTTSSKLHHKRQELEEIRSDLAGKTSELVGPDAQTRRRLELLVEIKELNSRKDAVEYQISRLSADLELHRDELADLEAYSVY